MLQPYDLTPRTSENIIKKLRHGESVTYTRRDRHLCKAGIVKSVDKKWTCQLVKVYTIELYNNQTIIFNY